MPATPRLELELARAEPGEAPELERIARTAWAEVAATPSLHQEVPDPLAVTPEYLSQAAAWTARLEGTLTGWGAWMAWGRRCRLEHLWITPAFQRQGLGRILLHHLAAEARRAGWTELEILAHPEAAGFYRRCGGQEGGESRDSGTRGFPIFLLPLSLR